MADRDDTRKDHVRLFHGRDRSETDAVELLCSHLSRRHFRRPQRGQLGTKLARIVIADKCAGLDVDLVGRTGS